MKNYLMDRHQRVRYKFTISDQIKISSGVPQGSVLGPYIFNSFVGDLHFPWTNIKSYRYADDVTLLISYNKSRTPNLNEIMDYFKRWCDLKQLKINESKTKIMNINTSKSVNNFLLANDENTYADQIKILGVIFNKQLKWNAYCDSIIKKATSRLYVLRTMKNFIYKDELICIYNSLIRSIIEYASEILLNTDLNVINKLESAQNKAHKIICGPWCKNECLQNISERRVRHANELFNTILNNQSHLLHHILPVKSPRSERLIIPYCRTNRLLKSFIVSSAIEYNKNIIN